MAKKMCIDCGIRPQTAKVSGPELCEPCYEFGGHENTHDGQQHAELTALQDRIIATEKDRTGADVYLVGAVELRKLAGQAGVKSAAKFKSAELRVKIIEAIETEQAGCWVCHPGLDQRTTPKARKASEGERPSRKGQIINVPLRAPGEVKAQVVIKAAGEERATLKVLGGGVCVLDVNVGDGITLHLAWDVEGRYDYAEAYVKVGAKQKAVRNVAEALRIIRTN